jgi:hypothetical protein
LYLRSAEGGPFGLQGLALWRATLGSLSTQDAGYCNWVSRVGFNHGFEKATFDLEPGQWISFEPTDTTISYQGSEKHLPGAPNIRGARFLPVQHTELAVGPMRSTRRHFIERFTWVATGTPRTWQLQWSLDEVVRDTLVSIANDSISSATAPEPPARIDVRDFVRLDVNAAGEAELVMAGGKNPYRAVIETAAERAEEKQRQQAVSDRAKRVDRSKTFDVRRQPSLTYANATACSGLAAAWSDDSAEVIVFRAEPGLLKFNAPSQIINLAAQSTSLEVLVHVYEKAAPVSFCSDVMMAAPAEVVWRAATGVISIAVSAVPARVHRPAHDRAVIRIDGAEFVSPSGDRMRATHPIVFTADVSRSLGGD